MKLSLSDAALSPARMSWRLPILSVAVCAVAAGATFGQSSGSRTATTPSTSAPAPSDTRKAAPTQVVVVSDPRQAQIVADSEKLLKLSQELKAEVAKSSKDTLSLTVIRKAEEVEKLAKALKEEMNKSR